MQVRCLVRRLPTIADCQDGCGALMRGGKSSYSSRGWLLVWPPLTWIGIPHQLKWAAAVITVSCRIIDYFADESRTGSILETTPFESRSSRWRDRTVDTGDNNVSVSPRRFAVWAPSSTSGDASAPPGCSQWRDEAEYSHASRGWKNVLSSLARVHRNSCRC